ncbi:flavodoxin family protein [Staphylococcus succinus]|uniref:flavodoxin family protein n=1 Tax=Staphylococcus succinus TaxID=61015 RepID=UPI000E691C20|nr:NAD(P)H-dependent oxidoreductase [Staphylococcus succinus]RIN36946.1 flavodoxin family protein [Staphylococcus succinus]
MQTIVAFVSSRNPKSKTLFFVKKIKETLLDLNPEVNFEIISSNTMNIYDIYEIQSHNLTDDLSNVQKRIKASDFFILASPIMVHNISTDMKSFIERCSNWAHTMELLGKKSYVITTNYSNGHRVGIDYLYKTLTYFGSKVVGATNASSFFPNQLEDHNWVNETTKNISKIINDSLSSPKKSSESLESIFIELKKRMLYYSESKNNQNTYHLNHQQEKELQFWIDHHMISANTFESVINKS